MSVTIINENIAPYVYIEASTGLTKTRKLVECMCNHCHKNVILRAAAVKNGTTQSCGCIKNKKLIHHSTSHGLSKNPIYAVHQEMIAVCARKTHPQWSSYGGAKVTVSERWKNVALFFYDMGGRPTQFSQLALINYDNPCFEKGNCTWIEGTEQKISQRIAKRLRYKFMIRSEKTSIAA